MMLFKQLESDVHKRPLSRRALRAASPGRKPAAVGSLQTGLGVPSGCCHRTLLTHPADHTRQGNPVALGRYTLPVRGDAGLCVHLDKSSAEGKEVRCRTARTRAVLAIAAAHHRNGPGDDKQDPPRAHAQASTHRIPSSNGRKWTSCPQARAVSNRLNRRSVATSAGLPPGPSLPFLLPRNGPGLVRGERAVSGGGVASLRRC